MVFTKINNDWRFFDTKEEARKAVAKEVRGIKDEKDNAKKLTSCNEKEVKLNEKLY